MSIHIATIDDETVSKLTEAAAERSRENGKPISIAICDVGANLKSFLRMDGASLISSKTCQDKAYTSAATRRPTHVNYERIKDDAPLVLGMVHTPRLIIFGGGYPIVLDGQCIGAIGVSGGGHWSKDMDYALAALRSVGAKGDWD